MSHSQALYITGLLETMCFKGVSNKNYWYMRGGHLYHCDPVNEITHKKPLDRNIHLHGWQPIING